MAHNNVIVLLEFYVLHAIGQQSWEHFLDCLINWVLLLVKHDVAFGDLGEGYWDFWDELESVKLVFGEVAKTETKILDIEWEFHSPLTCLLHLGCR